MDLSKHMTALTPSIRPGEDIESIVDYLETYAVEKHPTVFERVDQGMLDFIRAQGALDHPSRLPSVPEYSQIQSILQTHDAFRAVTALTVDNREEDSIYGVAIVGFHSIGEIPHPNTVQRINRTLSP